MSGEHPLLVWDEPAELREDAARGAANTARCVVGDCRKPQAGRGLCSLHHHRFMAAIPLVADHEDVGLRPSGMGVWGIMLRDEDGVQCHECGQWFGALASHLVRTHGITGAEYRRRHGLPAGAGLESLRAQRARQANSRARVGGEAWARFERRRDETLPQSQRKAAEAARRENLAPGAAMIHAETLRAVRAGRRTKRCRHCGGPMPTEPKARHLRDCSRECAQAAHRAAAWRRSAERAGEPLDFQRRAGTGAQLTADQIEAQRGMAARSWVRGVYAGRYPAHDGRTAGEPWWWESSISTTAGLSPATRSAR